MKIFVQDSHKSIIRPYEWLHSSSESASIILFDNIRARGQGYHNSFIDQDSYACPSEQRWIVEVLKCNCFDLLADMTSILIEELLQQPPEWNSLQVNHNIVDALKDSVFKASFDRLVPELQIDVLRIVRYVLLIFQDAGIDQSEDHLIAI